MKLRNQLLALACLLVFAAAGYLYVRTWVVQKPFGVILFVSDGLVARHLTAARLYEGGADHALGIESFPHLALLRNSANDFAVPDDAAAASALATGVRVNHHMLAVDQQGHALETITDLARAQGRSIGIVTNGSLTSPTVAAFYAHTSDSRDSASVALQLLEKFRPEVALGGGANDFLPMALNGRRKDGRDLLAEFRKQGCRLVRSKADLENTEAFQESGVLGVFAAESLAFGDDIEAASQQPSLADMVRRAISFLQQNGQGYLLVVDAALVGTAAERNEGERAILETIALDKAIATAEKYAGEKSLIIAAGRHSTAGMTLNGFPLRQDRGVALLGFGTNFNDNGSALRPDRGVALPGGNASGYPYITWATGPNGPVPPSQTLPPPAGEPTAPPATPTPQSKTEPAAFHAPTGMSNAEDVIAVGRGAGSERLHGFLDNTEIFSILKSAL